ncbi:hypothetical protein C8J57DRAFT_1467552, partial [Mycena rebaudengoi]
MKFLLYIGVVTDDPSKVGFYGGLRSSYAATQLLAIWQWAQLSDYIGRREAAIYGTIGVNYFLVWNVPLFIPSDYVSWPRHIGSIIGRCQRRLGIFGEDPLFFATEIGYSLALSGMISGGIDIILLPILPKRFNATKLYNFCMCGLAPSYYFLRSISSRNGDLPDRRPLSQIWPLCAFEGWVAFILVCTFLMQISISMVLGKENAPNHSSLGSANGIVQFAMLPARGILGGYFWILLMALVSLVECSLTWRISSAARLLKLLWRREPIGTATLATQSLRGSSTLGREAAHSSQFYDEFRKDLLRLSHEKKIF